MHGDLSDLFRLRAGCRAHDLNVEAALGRVHHLEIGVIVHPHVEGGRELFDVARHEFELAVADVFETDLFHVLILTQMFR